MLLVKCWWNYHLGNNQVLFLGVNWPKLILLFACFLIYHLEVCWDQTLPKIESENSLVELTPGVLSMIQIQCIINLGSIVKHVPMSSKFYAHVFVWKQIEQLFSSFVIFWSQYIGSKFYIYKMRAYMLMKLTPVWKLWIFVYF